jgi:hypothetical protein
LKKACVEGLMNFLHGQSAFAIGLHQFSSSFRIFSHARRRTAWLTESSG